jgi:hypothetical protein
MKIWELQPTSLDLKWTADILQGEVGPHMDLTLSGPRGYFGCLRAFARVVDPAV